MDTQSLTESIANGRTDLVFELLSQGHPAHTRDAAGTSLIEHCAYYGDVSAIRYLLGQGESLTALGEKLGLNAAAFHGHWRLGQFLLERCAAVNASIPETGETPLHACLCTTDRLAYDRVLAVLLAAGADPNLATRHGVETGGFMRDCRTKGETALHRAAAFGEEHTIQMLIDAGAKVDMKDANGDSPLAWASWYVRPASILRLLCYGSFRIRPGSKAMRANLLGEV